MVLDFRKPFGGLPFFWRIAVNFAEKRFYLIRFSFERHSLATNRTVLSRTTLFLQEKRAQTMERVSLISLLEVIQRKQLNVIVWVAIPAVRETVAMCQPPLGGVNMKFHGFPLNKSCCRGIRPSK